MPKDQALDYKVGLLTRTAKAAQITGVATLLALASIVPANAFTGWVNAVHHANIRSGTGYVTFETSEANVGGCTNNEFYSVPTANNSQPAPAIPLTAYTINIYVNGCDVSTGISLVTDVMLN